MHDDDPAQGSESPEQDPLAALLRPAERSSVVDPGAADAFQQRANLAEDRLAEVLSAYRQLKTENEGFRERITRNFERRFDQRRERLLLKFIEILDNLDRALEATEQTYTGTPMIEGIILVRTQLLSVLQEEGLERIPVLALPYDPSVAEAVETRPVTEPEHHHVVVKELMRGYRLHGRVARAARVAVGEYTGEAAAAAPEAVEPEAMVGADETQDLVGADEAQSLVGADEAQSLVGAEETQDLVGADETGPPVGADEADSLGAAQETPLPAPAAKPVAHPTAVRGLDAALDDLIAPEVEELPSEIDLLKEVLGEDDR